MPDEIIQQWFKAAVMYNYPTGSFNLGEEPRTLKNYYLKNGSWYFEFSTPNNKNQAIAIKEGEFLLMIHYAH